MEGEHSYGDVEMTLDSDTDTDLVYIGAPFSLAQRGSFAAFLYWFPRDPT